MFRTITSAAYDNTATYEYKQWSKCKHKKTKYTRYKPIQDVSPIYSSYVFGKRFKE